MAHAYLSCIRSVNGCGSHSVLICVPGNGPVHASMLRKVRARKAVPEEWAATASWPKGGHSEVCTCEQGM